MDKEIIWSPEAVEDLESIVNYISKDSEFYALHEQHYADNYT